VEDYVSDDAKRVVCKNGGELYNGKYKKTIIKEEKCEYVAKHKFRQRCRRISSVPNEMMEQTCRQS
jgi:hypothetical protein